MLYSSKSLWSLSQNKTHQRRPFSMMTLNIFARAVLNVYRIFWNDWFSFSAPIMVYYSPHIPFIMRIKKYEYLSAYKLEESIFFFNYKINHHSVLYVVADGFNALHFACTGSMTCESSKFYCTYKTIARSDLCLTQLLVLSMMVIDAYYNASQTLILFLIKYQKGQDLQ